MRLDINSRDRLGITQEILSAFVKYGWNLAAMEMFQFHTFVHIDQDEISLEQITSIIAAIDGVERITLVDFLPSEQKQKHLQALITKLPDPIIDIGNTGNILIANNAAELAFNVKEGQLEGADIAKLTGVSLSHFLNKTPISTEVSINDKSFLMDITPVKTNKITTGAVIVFRSPQRLGQQISAIQAQEGNIDFIVGQSNKMQAIKQQTLRFSSLDLPVLIRGETGTGKELIARALHESGPRSSSPFLAINCATLAENLLESELFGYASGAFTGAQRGGKPGLFELAENGTVFLDEIGEMSIYLQAKLLRFLQDFTFRRIGGTHEITVNIRIICATHRDLESMTQGNEFRDDLFYRLNVLSLDLPPLRQRIEDIPALVDLFAMNASEQINVNCPQFSQDAIELLKEFTWPGNIRQLQNVIFRTLALTDKVTINGQDLCFNTSSEKILTTQANRQDTSTLEQAVEAFETELLTELYPQYPSTRKLAKRLAVSHAKISRKLNKYGIKKEH